MHTPAATPRGPTPPGDRPDAEHAASTVTTRPRRSPAAARGLLRPTFELELPGIDHDHARDRLVALLNNQPTRFAGQSVTGHVVITHAPDARRSYSPWLHLDILPAETPEQGCRLFARFTPAPGVWTAYMLTGVALLAIFLGALAWGLSQIMLQRPPTAFWALAATILIAAAMLAAARLGQRLAQPQMRQLRDAALDALQPTDPRYPHA